MNFIQPFQPRRTQRYKFLRLSAPLFFVKKQRNNMKKTKTKNSSACCAVKGRQIHIFTTAAVITRAWFVVPFFDLNLCLAPKHERACCTQWRMRDFFFKKKKRCHKKERAKQTEQESYKKKLSNGEHISSNKRLDYPGLGWIVHGCLESVQIFLGASLT